MYPVFGKRILDLIISTLLILVFSPVLLALWLLLIFTTWGKPFFYQERPGKDSRIFHIIKFRTMKDSASPQLELLGDAERMTFLGYWIRKTSLDELPQLFNVIKGQMSLVGPRPLLVEYLPLYNQTQHIRHRVKPGITGWAQINGRNGISWEKKFELDVWYTQQVSFLLDLKILILTLLKVLQGRGISQEGQATVKKFTGTNPISHRSPSHP